MAKIAFLFPGQGSQALGMGAEAAAECPAARALFDEASAILGYDLLKSCVEGPAERLNSTAVSQPALYVCGLAAAERLKQREPETFAACAGAAGLSLGEYTALTFAGAWSFADGLRVVKVRGESMQAAADALPSGMASVLGLDAEKLEALRAAAAADGRLWLANFLCPGNVAVSGEAAGCAALERLGPEMGATKVVRLQVAGAFHTPIMQPAVAPLQAALAAASLRAPRLPVYSNVDAVPHGTPDAIRTQLARQVVEPVQWEATQRQLLADGFDKFFELGPGRTLAGLMKRVLRKAEVANVSA